MIIARDAEGWSAECRLLGWNTLLQLFKPVEDHLDLRSARGSSLTFSGRDDANKSFAVRSDVVLPLRKRNRSKRQASSCWLWFRIAKLEARLQCDAHDLKRCL